MPGTTILDIPQQEQDPMLVALRRARDGDLLALHVILLCAAGRNPTEIAAFLFCSRSSVYRVVRLYRAGRRATPSMPLANWGRRFGQRSYGPG